MKFLFSAILGALLAFTSSSVDARTHQRQHRHTDQQTLADAIKRVFPIAPQIGADEKHSPSSSSSSSVGFVSSPLPVVFVHGMGDSCFNPGMASLPNMTSAWLNTYSICVPGGATQIEDTLSSFLVTMDANVDYFAKQVEADPKLADGFYAVGLSQGNLILRGYMHKYNNKPVMKRVLHIHGTLMGVAAIPRCPIQSSEICNMIAGLAGGLAYNELMQGILFQADYLREPAYVNTTAYQTFSQIAQWNGENPAAMPYNPDYKTNFLQTDALTMIKALKDTMIDPNESEWWGSFAVGNTSTVLPMEQTPWYLEDTFGLQTMDKADRLLFNTSAGDHLQFTEAELKAWMTQAGFVQQLMVD